MKAYLILGPALVLMAYFVFSPNRQNFEIQAREEKRNGEIVPIVGEKIGFDEMHVYGKAVRFVQHSTFVNTDTEGKATLSFDDNFFSVTIRSL